MPASFAKIINLITILFLLINSNLFSNPTYRMTIEGIEVLSGSSVQASVYIENIGDEFELTSYQCALSINQEIDLSSLSLSYLEGSSELLNKPDLYIGIDNIDGPTELTFVSFIGNDIISTKTLLGTFILEGQININNINLLNIQWDFEGTVSTILTGANFANITNPASHESIFPSQEEPLEIAKVNIMGAEASAITDGKYYPEYLYDGKTSEKYMNDESSDKSGRWAVAGFPQWVTIDLGEETYIDNIKLDPFGSEKDISYDCEFYTGTYNEKTLLSSATTKVGGQWSEHSLSGIRTRYLTIVVTGSEGNNWCDFWELEIYGNNSTTGVEEEENDEEVVDEETIPSEYGISQNYPNPFNPTTKIQVRMKESGSARLNVYNILGERVLAVLDTELSAGVHEVSIDGSRLGSGVYIYKLDVDNNFSQIKKMNLIK
jgi:Secretion system C-terminal sorting domain/F5/8 type C domain